MKIINIKEFEDQFVLYFAGKPRRINAYTLASSLVSVADAVKSSNSLINPGYSVEVVVESFGEGSFKVNVKTIYNGAKNLFSTDNLKSITLSVIAAYIYQNTLSPNFEVIVNSDEVIITQGDEKIIIPREVHDAVKEMEKSEKFKQSISKMFETIGKDNNVEAFGITPRMSDDVPTISIPRSQFGLLSMPPEIEENSREIIEVADLSILRAILERGTRKWEFVWRGIKISAPVLDDVFFSDFFAHKITIAPGDSIEVNLKIYQNRDKDVGIFTNARYEVIEVIKHIPRMKQSDMNI